MQLFIKRLSLIVFFSGILLPFNNCSYIDTSVFDADQGSLNASLPSISFNAPNPLRITGDVQVFTINGICSAGIYSSTEIYWTLHTMNETYISDSSRAGSSQFLSACVNGQYAVDVRVPCPGLTNSGPNCYGLLEPLRLRLHIQGRTAAGAPAPGALGVSVPLTLNP